jgi:hypothetical protein
MAAPLGYKDFTTGEVLTANDVDGYLMQGIWVFANATARDAAVTSPQEGNACYLKDTDVIMVYTGSAWATQSASNPISANIVDAKGDLIAGTAADTVARLAIGTNDQVLTADSTAATGMKWATVSGGASGPAFQAYSTPTQTVSSTTNTKATMTNEAFDTDNCFASSRFTPTKAGYYLITGSISYTASGSTTCRVLIYKNGSNYGTWNSMSIGPAIANPTLDNTVLMYLNGSTDYVELYGWSNTASPEFYSSTMQGVWVRS